VLAVVRRRSTSAATTTWRMMAAARARWETNQQARVRPNSRHRRRCRQRELRRNPAVGAWQRCMDGGGGDEVSAMMKLSPPLRRARRQGHLRRHRGVARPHPLRRRRASAVRRPPACHP
jgi:hypothetical protein